MAEESRWFAIKTRQDAKAAEILSGVCDEVYFPTESVTRPGKRRRAKALIPHVLFIKTTRDKALALEAAGRDNARQSIPMWIYRYPHDNEVQEISQRSIDLLRLLTSDDTTRCRIYTAKEFSIGQRVRVTDGLYKDHEGFVKRIEKNKHVIVSIEGICMVILPYIHPDLLSPLHP